MKNNYIVVFVTCCSEKEASDISGRLLKKRLVACANIINGVRSKFWWAGKIDKASETMVMFKTVPRNFKAIEKEVIKLHSYDVPEIIALPIVALSGKYARWIDESVV